MTFTFYDYAYYGALLPLLGVYALSLKTYRIGGVSSFFFFRNASVIYFSVFSILLGKFVYEGSILDSAKLNTLLYFLMLYYAIVLLGVAAIFNLLPSRDVQIASPRLNIIPFLIALAVKAGLLAVETTPMQELFFNGFAAAHIKQFEWHQPGHSSGLVQSFYAYFSPVVSVLFIVYFTSTRSILFKLLLLVLTFETSGFYFSKSGLIVPLMVLLILSGIKLRYLPICVLVGVVSVFAVRLGTTELLSEQLMTVISERFVAETGYGNPQLELYEAEHPPLGYEARYYLGFNTLFGIEPAVDASREAYLNETGRYGATSSGHAAVSLYAFWGLAFYLVLPILVAFVFYVDRMIVSRLSSYYGLAGYVFVTFKAINYLTVDIQRLISFQTIIDLTFLSSILLIWIVGRVLRLRGFSAPITLFGHRGETVPRLRSAIQ